MSSCCGSRTWSDHLLDVSRINERRLELRLEEIDLSVLVRGIAAHLEEQLGRDWAVRSCWTSRRR